MPEVSNNAAVFLATSYQALKRAEISADDLRLCNSIICLIFACFYIEETLDVIIEESQKNEEFLEFVNNNHNAGMFQKMAWFYNANISQNPVIKYEKFFDGDFHQRMEAISREFINFDILHQFRNNISHGKIDKTAHNFRQVKKLRQSAKDIGNKLLHISNLQYIRNKTYNQAIVELTNQYHEEL